VVVLVPLCSSSISDVHIRNLNLDKTSLSSPVAIDACPYCFQFTEDAVNDLLDAILNGLLGSCGTLCQELNNAALEIPCVFICEYVGFKEFVDVMNDTDPDPIYICQEFDMCPVVNGGQVTITSTTIDPEDGPAGTMFNVTWTYEVIQPTGPGTLNIVVIPPKNDNLDFEFGFGYFQDAQPVGTYIAWGLIDTTPTETEYFAAGVWTANVAVCEGDCTNNHPYGGVYAQANVPFTLLNSTITSG